MAIRVAQLYVAIDSQTKGAEDGLKRVNLGINALSQVGQTALGYVLGNVVTNLGKNILGLGSQALEAYGSFERMGLALQQLAAREMVASGQANSVTEAWGQASGKAKELQSWVQKLAIESPFTTEGIMTSLRTGMAFGFTSTQAKRLSQALTDFSAGSGASTDVMNRISLSLGQIKAMGKVAGAEMRELALAGLPVMDILAKAFGVTTAELLDMRAKGLIPADQALEAIITSMETDFAGAAKNQALSISGLSATFEDLKNLGLRELFGGIFEEFRPDLIEISNLMQDPAFQAGLRDFGREAAGALRETVDMVKQAISWFRDLQPGTQGAAVALGLLAVNAKTVSTVIGGIMLAAKGLPLLATGIQDVGIAWKLGIGVLEGGVVGTAAAVGALTLAIGALVGVWIAWNENIAKTNEKGVAAAGAAMSDMLQGVAAEGGDAAAVTEEFTDAYQRMQGQIKKGGSAGSFVNQSQVAKGSLQSLSDQLIKMGTGYEEYSSQMMRAVEATGQMNTLQYQNMVASGKTAQATQYLSQNFGMLTQQQFVAAQGANMYADDLQRAKVALQQTNVEVVNSSSSFLNQGQAASISAQQMEDLQGSWANLQQAQQTFNQSFGDQVVNKLEQAGVKGEALSGALGMIDQNMGTNYLATQKANEALDEAIKNYKKTGDIAAFDDALDKNKSQWEKINGELQTAIANWNEFITSIAEANGMHIAVVVDIVTGAPATGNGAGQGGGGGVDTGGKPPRAMGGTVTAGELYMTGERGPEPFVPNGNGYVASAQMFQQLTSAIRDLARGGIPQGAQLAPAYVTINESTNPRRTARAVGSELSKLQRR